MYVMDGEEEDDYALGYLRISDADPDDVAGVTRQREDVVALAQRLGVPLRYIYVDNDVTASKPRSEDSAWGQMVKELATKRAAKYVLGWKMDRLGRRLSDIEGLDDRAQATGLKVYTTREGDVFENPAWPFLAAQAKMESRNTAIRVRRAQEAKRKQGRDQGGQRPYGYTAGRAIIPEEAARLRTMASLIIAGESRAEVVRIVNAKGWTTVQGKKWSPSRLSRTLSNPRYAGKLTHKGEVVGLAAWEPVLDPATWAALQNALAATAKPRGGAPVTTLLGGIARCGLCNAKMVGHPGPTKTPQSAQYLCSTYNGGCGKVRRSRKMVDAFVLEDVRGRLADEIPESAELAEAEAALDRLQRIEVETQVDILDARERYKRQELSNEVWFATLDALNERIRDAQSAQIRAARAYAELRQTEEARNDFDAWSTAQQRAFIKSKYVAVLIYPAGRGSRRLRPGDVKIIPKTQKSPDTL